MPLTFNAIFLEHISFQLKDFLVQPVYEERRYTSARGHSTESSNLELDAHRLNQLKT